MRFFLSKSCMLRFSQKKKRCMRMISKIAWTFVTSKVIPSSMPNNIATNTSRIILKLILNIERGSNMYMESPKPTEMNPNKMYGSTFSFFKSVKLTRILLFLALWVFSASFKLVLSAFLMGRMALSSGTSKPMARACNVAFVVGQIVG